MLTLPTFYCTLRYNQSRLKVPKDGPPQCLACLPVLGEDSSIIWAWFFLLTHHHRATSERSVLFCKSSWPHQPHPFPALLIWGTAVSGTRLQGFGEDGLAFWLQCHWWAGPLGSVSWPSSKRVMPVAWAETGPVSPTAQSPYSGYVPRPIDPAPWFSPSVLNSWIIAVFCFDWGLLPSAKIPPCLSLQTGLDTSACRPHSIFSAWDNQGHHGCLFPAS